MVAWNKKQTDALQKSKPLKSSLHYCDTEKGLAMKYMHVLLLPLLVMALSQCVKVTELDDYASVNLVP